MSDYRGIVIHFVRDRLRTDRPEVLPLLRQQLSLSQWNVFEQVDKWGWVPIHVLTPIVEQATLLIYPGVEEEKAHWQMGYDMARLHLSGLLRHMIRNLTIPSLIQQAAQLWQVYSRIGRARTERLQARSIRFMLDDVALLPEVIRIGNGGYIESALLLTGARDVVVQKQSLDHSCIWQISWSRRE